MPHLTDIRNLRAQAIILSHFFGTLALNHTIKYILVTRFTNFTSPLKDLMIMSTQLTAIALLASLGALFTTGNANAADLPTYDLNAYCKIATEFGPNQRAGISQKDCVKNQTTFYEELKERWKNIPDEMQRRCVASIGKQKYPTYIALDACIRLEKFNKDAPI